MATIIGVTALPLTKEQQQQLCAGVAKGVCDAFHLDINVSSMMLLLPAAGVPRPQRHRSDHLFYLYRAQQARRAKA